MITVKTANRTTTADDRPRSVWSRLVVRSLVLAGVVGLTLFAVSNEGVKRQSAPGRLLGTLISSNCGNPSSFRVCGPQGPPTDPGPVVYPGASISGNLALTFYNPFNVDISVMSLETKFTNTFPAGNPPSIPPCDPTQFILTGRTGSDTASGVVPDVTLTFGSPAFIVPAGGQSTYHATLSLKDHGKQDACKGLPLTMTYTATAQSNQGATCVVVSTNGVTPTTGTSKGNLEVKSGTTWLEGATINGNVTVDANATLLASLGSITGNVTSSGGTIDLEGTSVGGNVQTTNASLGLGPSTNVGGNVQPTGGTVMCSSGSSAGAVHIGNGFQIQSLGATTNPVTICNTQITGNLQYTSNAAPAIFGGSSGCTGNTVGGNLQVQTNTAKVTIGGGVAGSGYGNTAGGNIQVSGNTLKSGTYPPYSTLTNNKSTGGNCQLSGNTPGIVGSANSAAKQNTCNGTA